MEKYLPKQIFDLCNNVLVMPAASELLRCYVSGTYSVGDEYNHSVEHPEDDGQNGTTQLLVLMSHLRIPVSSYMVNDDGTIMGQNEVVDRNKSVRRLQQEQSDEPHYVFLRYRHPKYESPANRPPRRFVMPSNGRTYVLIAVLTGQEHCGHQIAAVNLTDEPFDETKTVGEATLQWCTACVDARMHHIGPTHWAFDASTSYDDFFRTFGVVVPAIFFGGGLCDLSWVNRDLGALEGKQTGQRGLGNGDFMYVSLSTNSKARSSHDVFTLAQLTGM